jgi:hypothetical protein
MQDSILFVGTQGSGVYKSTNAGLNWTAVNNGLTSTNFRAIQAEGATVFAGGQSGTGVYRSIDFGENWTLLTNGIASSSYRGFASNNSIVLAGSTTDGVFYSLDNGDIWTQITDGLLDLNVFDIEINNNYIIAATHTQGVFRFPLSDIFTSEVIENEINPNRKLLKVVDLLGRETTFKPNISLIYIYDDGTVEKKMTLE